MHIIDGKKTAAIIRQELKDQVTALTARHGRAPGLAVILVGDHPASQVYVRNKERACEDVGIISKGFRLPADIPQPQLEDTITFLNSDRFQRVMMNYEFLRMVSGNSSGNLMHQ